MNIRNLIFKFFFLLQIAVADGGLIKQTNLKIKTCLRSIIPKLIKAPVFEISSFGIFCSFP